MILSDWQVIHFLSDVAQNFWRSVTWLQASCILAKKSISYAEKKGDCKKKKKTTGLDYFLNGLTSKILKS